MKILGYTRNTRIKVIENLRFTRYVAQVEFSFLGITWYTEAFNESPCLFSLIDKTFSLPFLAGLVATEKRGLEFAQAVIDEYHNLYDELEYKKQISYIKYP